MHYGRRASSVQPPTPRALWQILFLRAATKSSPTTALARQLSKLKKANVKRSGILKVTGHKNIQSLNDYDESNEDKQRQLSYVILGRNNFNPQPTVSREVHDQQEPLASSAPS